MSRRHEHPARTEAGGAPPASRRRLLIAVVAGIGLTALAVVADAATGHPVEHAGYWWWRRLVAPAADTARIVFLGDSSMLGIGATTPGESLAGRTLAHVELELGRPAHAVNVAVGGASAREVVDSQLPAASPGDADLVFVSVGSSDAGRGTSTAEFEAAIVDLFDRLPARRTVVSDIPVVPGTAPLQAVLTREADARGIRRAPFLEAFEAAQRLDVRAPDGLHLNSTGYGIWFESCRPAIDAVLADR